MALRLKKCRRLRRNGVTAAESAIVLPAALLVLFSLLDLGLATLRYNTLAEASRRVAREAILHGSLAPEAVGGWGPVAFTGTAANDSPLVAPLEGMLPTMPEELVNVEVTWPDGDNGPHDRVHVAVSFLHHPVVPFFASWGPLSLRSSTTMNIVN